MPCPLHNIDGGKNKGDDEKIVIFGGAYFDRIFSSRYFF